MASVTPTVSGREAVAEPTVERYAKRYPDVSPEVILKEDLLRLGMYFTDAALAAARDCRHQAYFLFSYNISGHGEMGAGVSTAAPEDIRFHGGPYGFRPTWVRVVLNKNSPYVMDLVDGVPTIHEHGIPLAQATYPTKPAYYGRTFPDGTKYEQVIPLLYDSYAFITTLRACHYWGDKEECRFCDMNYNLREVRKLTGDHVTADAIKDKDKVVAVLAAMAQEPDPAKRMITILMTGGSIVRKVRGGAEDAAHFNLPFVEAIRERIGRRIPIVLIIEAQPTEHVKLLREAGVSVYNANLEVFDKRLFQIIAPGKEKYVGYDLWIRRLLEAVEVMGEGNVSPNMVSGIEMAQPWGFAEVDDAVKSAAEGFEFLMSHGVVPHLDTWCVESGTALAGHPPIPLDFLIRADLAWYETWRKYKLPPFAGYGPMGGGPGHAVYGNTASVDLGG
jgi:hypothetical protein